MNCINFDDIIVNRFEELNRDSAKTSFQYIYTKQIIDMDMRVLVLLALVRNDKNSRRVTT